MYKQQVKISTLDLGPGQLPPDAFTTTATQFDLAPEIDRVDSYLEWQWNHLLN